MFTNLTGWHLLILFAVVLLLFGTTRLPALSRSIGQSMRIIRTETRDLEKGASTEEPTDPPST
jgi:sec-independent protein translocase protein TatA